MASTGQVPRETGKGTKNSTREDEKMKKFKFFIPLVLAYAFYKLILPEIIWDYRSSACMNGNQIISEQGCEPFMRINRFTGSLQVWIPHFHAYMEWKRSQ